MGGCILNKDAIETRWILGLRQAEAVWPQDYKETGAEVVQWPFNDKGDRMNQKWEFIPAE
jgi:hypothetical protein